jgi:hypothetical protein
MMKRKSNENHTESVTFLKEFPDKKIVIDTKCSGVLKLL